MYLSTCGETLLTAPFDTFDYVLYITDGITRFKVICHKCVLLAHSLKLRELINNENFFDLEIELNPGYIMPALELIQYMYLKNPKLISQVSKVLTLCCTFEMSKDYSAIRNCQKSSAPQITSQNFTNVHLHVLNTEPESATLSDNFFSCVKPGQGLSITTIAPKVKKAKPKKTRFFSLSTYPRRRTRSNRRY
jgi:hypothetical protein